jgi:hypothetical protein
MKFQKKISMGNFLKKGEDFKDGDLLEVMNEGKESQGEFGTQNLFMLKIEGKEGNVSFNQTTINGMIDAYGEDSLGWIGKMVKAQKIKQNVAGKFIDVWYFSHPQAELTENGFVLAGVSNPKEDDGNIPIIEDGKELGGKKSKKNTEVEEIDVKDIPF